MTTMMRSSARPAAASRFQALRDYLDSRAGLDYLMLRIIVFCLLGIGSVMVFSSSMATSLVDSGTAWGQAARQSLMVFAGLIVFWIALRMPPRALRAIVPWLLVATLGLLVAVLIPGIGTGREQVGSQSWIVVGSFSLQPSELARVTIGLYGATALADKQHRSMSLRDPFMMYSLIAALMFALIVAQGDLGMAMSFASVVVFTLFFAGVNWRVIAVIFIAGVAALVAVFLGGGFRSNRFHTYFEALTGNIADTQGTGFQAYQGFLSLADGGLFGVGIGQSRAKWFYLPEATNDFIFAIVGEELGLFGGIAVIFLFAALGWFGIRTARRAHNQFQALVAATLTTGVVAQAFFNIGYVIGLLPVTGIQLPMISAGGTAAIITIGSMGVLANIARHEPEQVSAMQNYGRPLFDRLLFIPEPVAPDELRRGGRRRAPKATSRRKAPAQRREERFGAPVTARRQRTPGRSPESLAGTSSATSRARIPDDAMGGGRRPRPRGERGTPQSRW